MKDLGLDTQISIFANEVIKRRVLVTILFALTAIAVVSVGVMWPKIYQSESSILWSNQDPARTILNQPVPREEAMVRIQDQVELAREVIFSNKILDEIIEETGQNVDQFGNRLGRRQLELVKGHLKTSILIFNKGAKILAIAYKNPSPELAYLVVSIATELFIRETRNVKNRDSQNAFDFINRQVLDYKSKLDSVNARIIEFRKANVDLDSDTRIGVNMRVNQLKAGIRENNLALNEARVQKQSLTEQLRVERERTEQQLLSESQQANTAERAGVQGERLAVLQASLDTLRLSYTDNYPDIIQLREQIKNLKLQMEEDKSKPNSNNDQRVNEVAFVESPLYTRLAGEVADAETLIQTLVTRISDSERRLATELERANKVNALESELEEMTRDLDVTQTIYDDLLTRRENARVALNLQLENQGTRFKIQEPASVPIVPVGLRFFHFLLLSVPLAVLVPLGLIYALLFIDPRIRHEDSCDQEILALPVIGMIDHYSNTSDRRREWRKTMVSAGVFASTVAAVSILVVLKINQVIGV